MLFPRPHSWTPRQKRLIAGGAIMAVIVFGVLVYSYERYHRGPSESALFGTWETTWFDSPELYYLQFRADQTFSVYSSPTIDEETAFATGRWYAGGANIYVRFNADQMGPSRPEVWHIVDIAPDMFRIRLFRHGPVYIYKRVSAAATSASNQSTKLTAGNLAIYD